MKSKIPSEIQKKLVEWIDKEFKDFGPEKLAMAKGYLMLKISMIEHFLEMCIKCKKEKI